jgi:formate dehydrogenase accessory protein FdhE
MTLPQWDRRIRRANELISTYPFAAEGLRFYSRVATFQKSLYEEIQKTSPVSPKILSEEPLRGQPDFFALLPKFPGFLSAIEQIAPVPLAHAAARLVQEGSVAWQQAIQDFWLAGAESPANVSAVAEDETQGADELIPSQRLLAWIFLQPYAEYLANRRAPMHLDGTPFLCPLCGGKPVVGVLRGEGDGAKKSLICMLCAHEWNFRRIYCPGCGEEREPQMAFYSAPEIAHVRVDVCDTCHTYLKTVDLTKTGLAVPVVDELATIPLDLWARDHGYQKLQINLLGT